MIPGSDYKHFRTIEIREKVVKVVNNLLALFWASKRINLVVGSISFWKFGKFYSTTEVEEG